MHDEYTSRKISSLEEMVQKISAKDDLTNNILLPMMPLVAVYMAIENHTVHVMCGVAIFLLFLFNVASSIIMSSDLNDDESDEESSNKKAPSQRSVRRNMRKLRRK